MIAVSFEVLGVGPSLWCFGVANTEEAKAESISETRSRLDDESVMSSVGLPSEMLVVRVDCDLPGGVCIFLVGR